MRFRLAPIAVALLVAACGGSSSPAASASSNTSAPVTVQFGLASVNMLYPAYVLGMSKSIFAKHGIDLQLSLTKDAATAVSGLVSQSLNIAAISTDAVILANSKQPDLGILAPISNGTPYTLVVNSKIKSVSDLKGQKIGASALKTADGGIVRTMLAANGMTVDKDYNLLITGDPAARTQSLIQGQVVGLAIAQPQVSQLVAQGFVPLIKAAAIPDLANRPFVSLAVSKAWAANHEQTVAKFLAAWVEATAYVYAPANKAEVIGTLSSQLKVDAKYVDAGYQDWIVEQKAFNKTCTAKPEGIQLAIKAAIDVGDLQPPGPKVSDVILPSKYCNLAAKS